MSLLAVKRGHQAVKLMPSLDLKGREILGKEG